MSLGVSQIEYWQEVNKPDKNTNSTNGKHTNEGGPGAIYLSYDVFLGLTVLGGLFALDHLYLRSPLTFLAKIIINILTLGTWWLYDASQAIFNRDVVKVFGLGVPGMGPKGIAAGVLASDVPDKKHMAFLIYALSLFFGGLFGLDSFIVGDKQSGIIRIICLITVIFAPIAILWWLFNIGKFFLKTKDVTSKYWEYFGAPPPADYGKTIIERIVDKFPILDYIVGPIIKIKNIIFGVAEDAKDLGEAVSTASISNLVQPIESTAIETVEAATKVVKPVLKATVDTVVETAQPVLNAAAEVAQPIGQALNKGLNVVQEGIGAVEEGIGLGRNVLRNGTQIVGETAKAATVALSLVPEARELSSGFTQEAAQAALTKLKQDGGGSSGILSYVMIGTLAVIIVSGWVLTYRRYRQNGKPQKDDNPPPPESRVLRESNKEKSS